MKEKMIVFVKKETVLVVAAILAVMSVFLCIRIRHISIILIFVCLGSCSR